LIFLGKINKRNRNVDTGWWLIDAICDAVYTAMVLSALQDLTCDVDWQAMLTRVT